MDFRKILVVLVALMILPVVAFAQHPSSITVDAPAGGFQWNSDNKILQITFTVTDDNGITDTTASLWYGAVQGANENVIVADYNIILNTCAGPDLTSGQICHYFWDARKLFLANQDLYVDVNATNNSELYDVNAGSSQFSVNNRALQGSVSTLLDIVLIILAALAVIVVIGLLILAVTGQPIVEAMVIGIGTIITLVILAIVLQFFLVL